MAFFDTTLRAQAPSIDPRLIQQASGGFLSGAMDKYNAIEAKNREIAKQQAAETLANKRLALQEQQARDTALQREAQNALAEKRLGLLQDQEQREITKQATEQFTNEAMADIYAQPTVEKQKAKLAEYKKAGGFNPAVDSLYKLRTTWEPKEAKAATPKLFYSPEGKAKYISEGGVVPTGYVSESTYNKQIGAKSGGTGSKDGKTVSKSPFVNAVTAVEDSDLISFSMTDRDDAVTAGNEFINKLITKGIAKEDAEQLAADGIRVATVGKKFQPKLFKSYLEEVSARQLGLPKESKDSGKESSIAKTLKEIAEGMPKGGKDTNPKISKALSDYALGGGF